MRINTISLLAAATTATLILAGPASADTIVIGSDGTPNSAPATVTVESWIRSDNVSSDSADNYQYVGSLAGGADLRGLFGFDLSDPLLDGVTINSVTVSVYQSATTTGRTGTSGSYDLDLSALTGAVTNAATWTNDAGKFGTTLQSISGDPTSVTQHTAFTFNSSAALVAYVQAALSGDAVQFGLKSDDLEALTERNFWSFGRVSGSTAAAPSITIDYTPVPEPGSLALMGLVGLCVLRRRRNG